MAAWSATVMSNMLFFLSRGMVRECGYPQARHCAREEWYSTVGCCVGCVVEPLVLSQKLSGQLEPSAVLGFGSAEFAVKFI